ncbi:MAG: epoxyqueuosine reductase [Proteobacteria bacterium]|nr:epoxyqueuosine reductase [Pseudomonadota bacterium]
MESTIKSFINNSPENSLKNEENDKAWMDPLVGFSSGDDPLYQGFKEYVGSFHWTPLEIFSRTFPRLKVKPDDLTVIGWVLPHNERTKCDNRGQTAYPSERWVRARAYGEEFNGKLREHVVATLQDSGHEAVAPMLSHLFERKTSERYGFASTWSERHVAYASGLGTFGLCDGLITPRGKAMRCGSVVAHIKIPPTKRPYSDHHAYCLLFTKGLCGKCIHRCPVKAITHSGHDKMACRNYIRPVVADYARSRYGIEAERYGCGLCQTGVPCESKIPTEDDVR